MVAHAWHCCSTSSRREPYSRRRSDARKVPGGDGFVGAYLAPMYTLPDPTVMFSDEMSTACHEGLSGSEHRMFVAVAAIDPSNVPERRRHRHRRIRQHRTLSW